MISKSKISEKLQKRTWYGVKATVIIGPSFFHTSGLGIFLIPHPAVVNWLLRKKIAESDRQTLTLVHEYKHLQSMPFILIYTLFSFALASTAGHVGLTEIIILAVNFQATWEIVSEILTINNDIHFYQNAYAEITIIPRIVFWFTACVLAITGWLILLL
jgi:hypothetical protein